MGLIENILISVIHIVFVAADVLFLVMLLKIVHDRWQIPWIEPILTAVKPAMSVVLNMFQSLVLRATGKSYPEKTLFILLILCLLIMRFLIISIAG
jgi:chromate transport protein ChrA